MRKVYKLGKEKVVALDDLSLDILSGEICCILGTSGSGKSTLLNLLAGLEKASRGSILIRGKNVGKMNERQLALFRQKNIGFVFQSYNLLSSLSALENVSLPLVFQGVKKEKREQLARALLQDVGLKTHLKHKPAEMSGGQQQRVGIARAFVGSPPIILADEPTGNLDSKTSLEVIQLMLKLAREKQQTLVIVTHDSEVADFADKTVFIRDGKIAEVIMNNTNVGERRDEV
ncbi:MAG: ABC transporter ATP-binding protein [Syntrophomonas sp.]|uniref:ABC transporter ATP-binding protein n=1 Tax=Syntrophomonas sp. TaxID=2053627 RepID=UPI002639AB23|nr:ABC transporter ATP-binding protein [Syntrophomonas sp.]MDD3879812.1 ABC transporter ATP-binding protein [Syntrophomonas sp.]MDD4627747.1 ABC transporter ATP-binding protein [Syntrophomonas sp.]